MPKLNWERWAAGSGIVFVVLFLIGFFVPGDPPDLGDSRLRWVAYVLDNKRELKVSAILIGLAFIAFLWFGASLSARLRQGGEQRLAAVAFGGAVATATVAFTVIAVITALAERIATDSPLTVKSWGTFAILLETMIAFPIAITTGAVAVAALRSKVFPQWYGALTGLGALVILFSAGALKDSGFYAPDGGYGFIALWVWLAWTVVTTGLLIMRAEPETPEARPVAA